MDSHWRDYNEASKEAADHLKIIAQSAIALTLSRLSLPEVQAAVEPVGWMIPAGNIPALILSGLLHLPNRTLSPKKVQQDITQTTPQSHSQELEKRHD